MRWLVLAILLAGCEDTILQPPCDQANLPLPPVEEARRNINGSRLVWEWDEGCYHFGEFWEWRDCTWHFDRLIKTREEGCPE